MNTIIASIVTREYRNIEIFLPKEYYNKIKISNHLTYHYGIKLKS